MKKIVHVYLLTAMQGAANSRTWKHGKFKPFFVSVNKYFDCFLCMWFMSYLDNLIHLVINWYVKFQIQLS